MMRDDKHSAGAEIVHVDLSRDVRPIASYRRPVHVFFWWKERPVGDARFEPSQLPISAITLLKRARAALPHDAFEEASAADGLKVSVAVCTRDRAAQLVRCLQALQHLKRSPHEIIVVDNASKDDAVRRACERFPNVLCVHEPRAGLDAARNAAVEAATGDIIAFTDDDVTVHPNWLIGLARGFGDPRVMATTGLVLPAELSTDAQLLFERYWGFNRGYEVRVFEASFVDESPRRAAPVWKIGAGASMAFRRSVFEDVGRFDERLDVGAAGCSGDSEMWYRILAAGGRCRYDPLSVAFHSHRRSLDEVKRQLFYYMRGHTASLLIQFERHRHFGNLARLLLDMPPSYLKLAARAVARGFGGRYVTLPQEIAGYVSGFSYYLRHRGHHDGIDDSQDRVDGDLRPHGDREVRQGGRREKFGSPAAGLVSHPAEEAHAG